VYFGLISSLIANSKVYEWNNPDLDIMTAARSVQKAVLQACYLGGINQQQRTKTSRLLSVVQVKELEHQTDSQKWTGRTRLGSVYPCFAFRENAGAMLTPLNSADVEFGSIRLYTHGT